jgi:hypothetical protein
MHVQVVDGLTSLRPGVDHQPVTRFEAFVFGQLACHKKELAQPRLVPCIDVVDALDVLVRDDEDVCRGLGVLIVESCNSPPLINHTR